MKSILSLVTLLITFCNLNAQNPKKTLSPENLVNNSIKSLTVFLDSAGARYTIPYDTINHFKFNNIGEVEYSYELESDVCFIKKEVELKYDGLKEIEIKSRTPIDCNMGIPIPILVEKDIVYWDGKLKIKENYRVTNSKSVLKSITKGNYDLSCKLLADTVLYEIAKTYKYKGTHFKSKKKLIEYHYNNQGNLTEKNEYFLGLTDSVKLLVKTEKIMYSKDMRVYINKRLDSNENKMNETKNIEFIDENGNVYKEEFYSNDSINFTKLYEYNENNLLETETGFVSNKKFAYRFVTIYE